MPLDKTCQKIRRNMRKQYGKKKGDQVFHASANAGKIPCEKGRRKKK